MRKARAYSFRASATTTQPTHPTTESLSSSSWQLTAERTWRCLSIKMAAWTTPSGAQTASRLSLCTAWCLQTRPCSMRHASQCANLGRARTTQPDGTHKAVSSCSAASAVYLAIYSSTTRRYVHSVFVHPKHLSGHPDHQIFFCTQKYAWDQSIPNIFHILLKRKLTDAQPVKFFLSKYRLGHPESYLFLLSKRMYLGWTRPKHITYNFENKTQWRAARSVIAAAVERQRWLLGVSSHSFQLLNHLAFRNLRVLVHIKGQ